MSVAKAKTTEEKTADEPRPSPLVSLPNELIEIIAGYLPAPDFVRLKFTCKTMSTILDTDKFIQNASLKTEQVCHLVFRQRANIFLTGVGGTGKTYTLKRICKLAPTFRRQYAITAPTGRASCLFENGQTIHSFSGLKLAKVKKEQLLADFKEHKKVPGEKNWRAIDLLILDEVSMLGASLMEKLDICARLARRRNEPFGGLQLVFSGDFLQLQPVFDKFAFTSPIWNRLNFRTIEMTVPVRQNEDIVYFHLLNRIRTATHTERDLRLLQSRMIEYDPELLIKPTEIYARNIDVERINQEEFKKVPHPIEYTFTAQDSVVEKVVINKVKTYQPTTKISLERAREKLESALLRQCPTVVELKPDVQYILTVNLDVKAGLVNGARCVYLGSGHFAFRKTDMVKILTHDFFFSLGGGLYLTRKQLPLKIGYATTVHSSQGMTLDLAKMDLGKEVFSAGMSYVALSRVKTLDSLFLTNFDPRKIRSSEQALEFYRGSAR